MGRSRPLALLLTLLLSCARPPAPIAPSEPTPCRLPPTPAAPVLHADQCGADVCLPVADATALVRWLNQVSELQASLAGCSLVEFH